MKERHFSMTNFLSFKIDRALLFLCLSFILLPAPILEYTNSDLWSILNISTLIACLIAFIIYCRKGIHNSFKSIAAVLFVLLMFASILVPNAMYGVESRGYVVVVARILLAYFAFVHLRNVNQLSDFVRVFAAYCFMLLLLNFISELLFPEGIIAASWESWQPYYVLTNANSFIFYYLFFVALIIFAFSNKMRRSGVVILVLVTMIASFLILGDATSEAGLICVALLLLIYASPLYAVVLRLMGNGYLICLVWIIFFIAIVVLGCSSWIVDLLNYVGFDASTLVSRNEIWRYALGVIAQNNGLGAGTAITQFSYGDGGFARSAHNTYLQIMYYGGVLGIISFFAAAFPSFSTSHISNTQYLSLQRALRLVIVMFALTFFVEQKPFFTPYYYLLLLTPLFGDYNLLIKNKYLKDKSKCDK